MSTLIKSHPQQWLLDQLEEQANYECTVIYGEAGDPRRSPTLDEIAVQEARLNTMRLDYEAAQMENNKYREAAAFIRAAMGKV